MSHGHVVGTRSSGNIHSGTHVEVYRWTGSGYQKASGDGVPVAASDVVVRLAPDDLAQTRVVVWATPRPPQHRSIPKPDARTALELIALAEHARRELERLSADAAERIAAAEEATEQAERELERFKADAAERMTAAEQAELQQRQRAETAERELAAARQDVTARIDAAVAEHLQQLQRVQTDAEHRPQETAPQPDHWDTELFARQLAAVGNRMRSTRNARGWTQHQLANRSGLARPRLAEFESGRKNCTLHTLWRIAATVQVHWADLLDDRLTMLPDGPPEPAPFGRQLAAFATRAYETRVLQHLSQQRVEHRTGIDRSAVSQIEAGAQNVTLETLSRLAVALHVHWADLLDDRDPNPPRPIHRR